MSNISAINEITGKRRLKQIVNNYNEVVSWAEEGICTYKYILIVTACTKPMQVQTRENPSIKEGSWHKVPPIAKSQFSLWV